MDVGKGGIVRDKVLVATALRKFYEWCSRNGYEVEGEAASAVTGAQGNQEVFVRLMPK
jgi:predicted rRNA methylase YqxC with S4 and FtsJ domains